MLAEKLLSQSSYFHRRPVVDPTNKKQTQEIQIACVKVPAPPLVSYIETNTLKLPLSVKLENNGTSVLVVKIKRFNVCSNNILSASYNKRNQICFDFHKFA